MPQGQRYEGVRSSQFFVDIDGIEEGFFTECGGLNVEVDVKSYEEGGLNEYVHKLPGRVKYSNVTLKRGLAYSGQTWSKWRDWCAGIFKAEGKPIERKNLTIRCYDAAGNKLGSWQLEGAFPVKWAGPKFEAGSTNVAIESLELAHNGFTYQAG
jgi:phage tail-like protein